MEKDSLLELLNEMDQITSISSENKDVKGAAGTKGSIIPNERIAFLLFPFFIELIDQFKNTLTNLKNQTQIFQEKFMDKEFSEYFSRMIGDDIKKIELVQNSLLNYIKLTNPIIKTNTVNTILEEELKKYQVELGEKKIKVFKTLEKDLPETAVPDDQLKYMVSWVLQYVMTLIPPGENFGLFTRSSILQKEKGEERSLGQKEERYIEILLIYTGHKKPAEPLAAIGGIPVRGKEGILDLTLRLVEEVVQRNRGVMEFWEDEKKQKTTISLKFPVERRKVVYYRPASELSSSPRQSKTTLEKLSSLEEMKKRG